jgi:biopolymer transport protein ExbD
MRIRGPRRVRVTGRLNASHGLILTSMIDILTTLLLFVLKGYVNGGEVSVPPPGLELPKSTIERPVSSGLVIAIDNDAIMVGADRVTTIHEAMAGSSLFIEPLGARLRAAQEQMNELAGLQKTGPATPHVVTIQGDRDIEFHILQKVMYTVNESGFDDIALAVLKKS